MSGYGYGYYTKDILSAWHSATPIFPDGKEEWIGYGDILYFSEDYGYTFSPIPIAMEEHHWSTISAFDMQYLHHGIAGIEWYSPDGNHTSIGQLL